MVYNGNKAPHKWLNCQTNDITNYLILCIKTEPSKYHNWHIEIRHYATASVNFGLQNGTRAPIIGIFSVHNDLLKYSYEFMNVIGIICVLCPICLCFHFVQQCKETFFFQMSRNLFLVCMARNNTYYSSTVKASEKQKTNRNGIKPNHSDLFHLS